MQKSIPERFVTAALFIAITLGAHSASTDMTVETISDVEIGDATVEAAATGEDTRLRFRLFNSSPETIVVEGLRSPAAVSGALTYFTHHGQPSPAMTVIMKPDETLDFSSSHLVATLVDLRSPLQPGDLIDFELVFRRGSARGQADVH